MQQKTRQYDKLYRADIYLLGLGLFELRQVTVETLDILRKVPQVLHLTSKHQQLIALNPNTKDLSPMYWAEGRAWDIYTRIARYVLQVARKASPIALAVEGNPMLFNDISWEVARIGRQEGLQIQALPGISCLDVLPIQLGFDMGDVGVQVIEATQLVILQLKLNPYLSTLLLQIGEFGKLGAAEIIGGRPCDFSALVSHLYRFFPRGHPAIFIQSSSAMRDPTVVFATNLASINSHAATIRSGMTLYLPRIGVPPANEKIIRRSGLKMS